MQNFIVDSNNVYFATDETGALYNKDFSTLVVCPGSKTEFNIPNSVTSIGYAAFWGCAGLSSVTIPNTVTSIGDFSFEKCAKLTSVVIPSSVKTIGGYAFLDCTGLISIDIPNSVVLIGDFSFGGCSGLTSVTIPNSLSKIGDSYLYDCGNYAFNGCKGITSLTFEDGEGKLTFGRSVFDGVKPTEVYYGRQMDFSAVSCSNLESVEFGENVTSIANKAFSSATSLRSVTAHSTVPPTIGDATFANDTYNEGKLYVENDAINAYTTADGWKNFVDVKALDGTSTGVSEISNNSTDLFRVANGAICVDGDTDVRIVSISGTTVYNGHGKAIVNVTPGVYIVIMGNTHAKVAVK